MKLRTAGLLVLVLGLALGAIGCKRLASALGRQEPIVDVDYQFRWAPPGPGWKLLGEKEARRLVPDAVAGAVQEGAGVKSTYAILIVEPYGGELGAYADLVVGNAPLEDKRVEARETLTFQKCPAVRTTMRGTVNGLKVIFQHVIFLYRGHGYQIGAWGVDGQVDRKTLGTAANAFTLLDGPVRDRVRTDTVADARGPGWRIKSGVFRSSAWGIEVAAPPNARIIAGVELAAINAAAEVGMATAQPEAYLIILPEHAGGADPGAVAKRRMEENVKSLDLEPETAGLAATVAGQSITLQRYHSKTQPFVYLQGAVVFDDTVLLLLAWHLKSSQDGLALDRLTTCLGAIRRLAPGPRQALTAELAALPDVQNAVGADYALRRGSYRDFAHGIVWQMPPGAFRLSAGPAARAVAANALLVLDEAGTGLAGLLSSEPAAGLDERDYHARKTQGRYESKRGGPKSGSESLAGGVTARSTVGNGISAGGLPVVEQTVTWLDGGRAYQVLLWAPRLASGRAPARFQELLAGLRVGRAAATVAQGDLYADLRLGFSFQPPPLDGYAWARKDNTLKEMAAIGTVVGWKHKRLDVTVIALYTMDTALDEESLLSRFKPKNPALALLSSSTSHGVLAGITGKRLRSGGVGSSRSDLVVIRRDRTLFGLAVDAKAGTLADSDLAAVHAGFRLLD